MKSKNCTIRKYTKTLINLGLALIIFASLFIYPSDATADVFGCFEGINKACVAPLEGEPLLGSDCKENVDWTTTRIPDKNVDLNNTSLSKVTVLSIHGGAIEEGTKEIASDLRDVYNWNSYSFNGEIKDKKGKCNKKFNPDPTDFYHWDVLHITSANFNDNQALDLVKKSANAVSIHGCNGSCPPSETNDTICIGGKNSAQKSSFFKYVKKYRNVISSYPRVFQIPEDPLNKNDVDAAQCDPSKLAGNAGKNIVNLTNSGNGGLQLEITKKLRDRLTDEEKPDDLLKNLIYGGVGSAMKEVPIPLVKLEEVKNLPPDTSSEKNKFLIRTLNTLWFANADLYLNSTLDKPLNNPAHPCGASFNSRRFVVEFNNGTNPLNSPIANSFGKICNLDKKDDRYYINYVKSISHRPESMPVSSKNIAYIRVRDRLDNRVYNSSGISIP